MNTPKHVHYCVSVISKVGRRIDLKSPGSTGSEFNKKDIMIFLYIPKGQLNSEWINEVIVSPKMPTKQFTDFCPTLSEQKSGKFLAGILEETMTS